MLAVAEFIAQCPCKPTLLRLQVHDWHVLGQNDKLGQAEITWTGAGTVGPVDQWLPLANSKASIHVQYCWTPTSSDDPPKDLQVHHLPSFRLLLSKAAYYPGEVIQGMITYVVRSFGVILVKILTY